MKRNNLIYLLGVILLISTHPITAQWILQNLPVSKPVSDIGFIDEQTGWACTAGEQYDSEILKTTNGGVNWLVQFAESNISYNSIDVINDTCLFAAGDSLYGLKGKLLKSTNGGTNWLNCNLPGNMRVVDMQFISPGTGWISGYGNSLLYITSDGGTNWLLRSSGISGQVGNIYFLDNFTGYCSNDRTLFKTTNNGLNWMNLHYFDKTLNAVFFLNHNTGWICGANSGPVDNNIYYTTNAGGSWSTQFTPPIGGNSTSIFFINGQTGWSGNRTNYIFKTTNGGLNWGYQNNPSKSIELSIIDSLRGWVCDNGISSTTNGGGSVIFTGINAINTDIPSKYFLSQNYPNPFNPVTNIKFDIPQRSNVEISIFDILGKEISVLVNEELNPGTFEVNWDASNFPSGVYFYKIETEDFSESRKMVLLK